MNLRVACSLAIALGAALVAAPRPGHAQSGAPSLPKVGAVGIHVVRPGDSLYTIGLRYGLTTKDLARLNGMTTAAILLPGRGVWVPLASASNALANSPARSSGEPTGSGRSSTDTSDGNTAKGQATYTVQPGDTLYAISRRFGAGVESLKRWNHLPFDGSIRAGEVLVVATGSASGTDLGAGGSSNADTAGRSLVGGRGATHTTYTVAPGDTLTSIAARFQSTAAGLRSQNGLVGDTVYAGQVLTVPRMGTGSAGGAAKRIEVVIGEQRLYAWEGDHLAWNFVVSTGISGFPTRRGTFAVQSKVPNAWSSAWQLWMPSWLGIYWAGSTENGIHALPIVNGQRIWAGYLGSPISYGCVVLGTNEASLLYDWAEIGTPVDIRD